MYNGYLTVRPNKNELGVFTTVDIPARTPIIEYTGDFFNSDNIPGPDVLQIAHNLYIGPSGNADYVINHSCNPNCFLHIIGKRAILMSLYQIKHGSELNFDYSTTSTDTLDEWKMDCNCGSFNCRKVISGFQYLDTKQQEEYKKNGMIPLFITHKIFIKG